MKFFTIVVLFAAVAVVAADKVYYDLEQAPQLFEQFKQDYNKQYKDEEDEAVHYNVFKKALEDINRLNEENPNTTFGINEFTDYTDEEYSNMRGLRTD